MARKKSDSAQPAKKTKNELLEEATIKFAEESQAVEPEAASVAAEEVKPARSNDQILAEEGLQISLPPSQVLLIVGLRSNGIPFFEVMGKNANLVTLSGVMEMAKRNLDLLWNKSRS